MAAIFPRRIRRGIARHSRAVVLGLVVLGFCLRLWVVVAGSPIGLYGDEVAYWGRARAILANGDPGTALQPPAMAYSLAIARWLKPISYAFARGFNLIWYLVGAVALTVLSRTWLRAFIPMVVYALHPVLIGFTGFLWSELLFLALLLAAVASMQDGGDLRAAAAGVLFALASLTRQIGVPFFGVILAVSVYQSWPVRARLWRAGIMALCFAIALTPWLVRNWVVLGKPVFTTNGGFALWVGNQREIGDPYGGLYLQLGQFVGQYETFGANELERDEEASRRGRAFIVSELPGWLWKKPISGLAQLFEPDNFVLRRLRLEHYGKEALPLTPWVGALTLGGEVLVFVWSIYVMLSLRDRAATVMLMLMWCGNMGIHALTVGQARHRLVLGVLPLVVTGIRRKPWSRTRAWVAVALTAALVGIGLAGPGRAQLADTFFRDGQSEQLP